MASIVPRCRPPESPTFTSIASNANGFVFGTSVSGSPYTTGANMNAGSGVPCNYPITGGTATFCGGSSPVNGGANNLGRIDIAVAPSNPSVIYAQVGSIDWNTSSGCGSTDWLSARRMGLGQRRDLLDFHGRLSRRFARGVRRLGRRLQ